MPGFKSKYGNKKTEINGIVFDSKAEASRYIELWEAAKSGIITGLVLQPRYVLQDAFKKNGKKFAAITYTPDFEYRMSDTGQKIIEDVKGRITQQGALRIKMFENRYRDLTITLIKR